LVATSLPLLVDLWWPVHHFHCNHFASSQHAMVCEVSPSNIRIGLS